MDVEHSAATKQPNNDQDKVQDGFQDGDAPSLSENRSETLGDTDLLGGEKLDAVLTAKMALVNDVCARCPD